MVLKTLIFFMTSLLLSVAGAQANDSEAAEERSERNISSELLNQTRDSLFRAEEVLGEKWESGEFNKGDLTPVLVTEIQPYSAESDPEFATRAIAAMKRAFRGASFRMCNLCLNARVITKPGFLDYTVGEPGLEDLRKIDESIRQDSPAARSTMSLRESSTGVSVLISSLANGEVLYAEHFTPDLSRQLQTERHFSRSADLQRRMSGRSLTHSFGDFGVLGYSSRTGFGAHVAFDWMEQWGEKNHLLSGFSFSFIGPLLGIGPTVGLVMPEFLNTILGAKVHLSLVNGLIGTISQSNVELFDPTVTFNGYARVPFGRSNYGLFVFVTSGVSLGIGISTLNTSFLPVLP